MSYVPNLNFENKLNPKSEKKNYNMNIQPEALAGSQVGEKQQAVDPKALT